MSPCSVNIRLQQGVLTCLGLAMRVVCSGVVYPGRCRW